MSTDRRLRQTDYFVYVYHWAHGTPEEWVR
jgi:hypothetical protein